MKTIRFLTPTIHGLLDYTAAIALLGLPWLLGFNGLALWLSVAGGAGLVAYSLLTDYRFGLIRALPFRGHLFLDLSAAAAFALAPFVFGWHGLVFAYYEVMAAGVLIVVAASRPEAKQRSRHYELDAV